MVQWTVSPSKYFEIYHFHPGSTSMIVGESLLDMSWFGSTRERTPFLFKFRVMEMKNDLRRFCRKEKRLIQVKVFKHMLLHILPPECQIYCKTKKKKMSLFKMTDAITLLRVSTFWPQLSVECFGFPLFGNLSGGLLVEAPIVFTSSLKLTKCDWLQSAVLLHLSWKKCGIKR